MNSTLRPKALPALGASPAELNVPLVPYLMHNRSAAVHWGTLLLFPIGALIFSQPLMLAVGFILLGLAWLKFKKQTKFYFEAEPHAAKIISLEPPLVAYYGDLAKTTLEPQPVVVVLSVDENLFPVNADTGTRIPLVALPKDGDIKRFDHFDARLVAAVITDQKVLNSVLESIPEWQWEELDESLFEVPYPYMHGAYAAGVSKF